MKKTIAELNETIEYKDEKISKLETALNKVKEELSRFKDFWRRLIRRFQTKVFDEEFQNIFETILKLGKSATINILNEMLEKEIIEKIGFSKNIVYKLK